MIPTGVTVPNELDSFAWEQCPDLNGQPVIRLFSDTTSWILWQSSLESSSTDIRRSENLGWRTVSLNAEARAESEPNVDVAYLRTIAEGSAASWLAVQLGSINSLDKLVDHFGDPPLSVFRDWAIQVEQSVSKHLDASVFLSHVLVTTDGRLLSLPSLAARVKESIRGATESALTGFSLPTLEHGVPKDIPTAGKKASVLLSALLDGTLKKPIVQSKQKPKQSISIPSTKLDALTPKQVVVSDKSKPQRSTKIVWISTAAAIVCAMTGGFAFWPSEEPKQVAQQPIKASTKADTIHTADTPTESAQSFMPDAEPTTPLELTTNEQLAPNDALANQASDSVQKLLSGLGGSDSKFMTDSVSFESVEAILKKPAEGDSVEQQLSNPTPDDVAAMPSATKPFDEPLEADMPESLMENQDSTASAEKASPEQPPADGPPEHGAVTQSITIQQAQSKKIIRVPFKPNDRQAVCRAKLTIPPDMLQNPVEPVELVGRQDTAWTVAVKDDSVSLLVYLRTKPAKAWYVATSVRAKLGPGIEFPIGPQDATQVCLRLQNFSRWLEQNRQLCESMKSNKKTRATAIAGLEEIEKRMKSTDQLLKSWIAIEELARAFYSQSSIELELASSHEYLPGTTKEIPAQNNP